MSLTRFKLSKLGSKNDSKTLGKGVKVESPKKETKKNKKT